MAAGILSPCSALWGAWAGDGGATSYGAHQFTVHNWRLPGDPVELQNWSTGTLRRGKWQHNVYVTSPGTVTTYAPATGPITDPPSPNPNARIWTDYPNSDLGGAPAPDWHVGAVFVPFIGGYYGSAGYVGGPVTSDGTTNSRTWTVITTPVGGLNFGFGCVADLEQHTGCCYFPVECVYTADDLAAFGIDQSSGRSLTWTITNDLYEPRDASEWASSGEPETSQIEISGYWLGDPPP